MCPQTLLQYVEKIIKSWISNLTGKQPIQQVKHYCHREKRRVNIDQPNILNQNNMSMEWVDLMDRSIPVCTINLRTKKQWCSCCWFIVDVAVNKAYQICRQSHLNFIYLFYFHVIYSWLKITHLHTQKNLCIASTVIT